ncbi:tetratricopeptide repeat protein [Arenimonas sp. MALMAid1274]|uniref:tetratricopeptide repeat protein n=1 Tax=Arenimonas sp. MALMAid1274 TaxID=3411630 RepID=UPI003BA35D52
MSTFRLLICLAGFLAPMLAQAAAPPESQLRAWGEQNDRARAQYDGGNKPEGVRLFEEAVAQGNPVSKLTLGWLLLNATDLPPRDPARGLALYEQSAEAGIAMAASNLGHHYAQGSGVAQDQRKALAWFERAADLGLAQAMTTVAWYHTSNAAGTGIDAAKAAQWYQRAADAGDAAGMVGLGQAYQYGKGVARDLEQSRRWYAAAAALGNDEGKNLLAALPPSEASVAASQGRRVFFDRTRIYPGNEPYQRALSMSQTAPETVALYQQAAAEGHPAARQLLGNAYMSGAGVPRDDERARSIWVMLSEEDCVPCQVLAGRMMMEGRGGPRDVDGARYWLEKAANYGNVTAMGMLGTLYDPRNSYVPNEALAIFWHQMAASKDNGASWTWLRDRGHLPKSPEQQAFIARIDAQGPDKSDPGVYNYEVAVYCQYGGSRCDQLRGQAYRDEQANNRAAAAANQQRLWNVYRREAADPDVRSECLRKKSESIWRSNSGKQDWYYAGEC